VNFLDFDLGWREARSVVNVTLSGVESDVLLVSATDAQRYGQGQQVQYWGGHYRRSPAVIRVPNSGNWHVLVVPGLGGRVEASVKVLRLPSASAF
jgi:Domain of unknown function (DUF1883)